MDRGKEYAGVNQKNFAVPHFDRNYSDYTTAANRAPNRQFAQSQFRGDQANLIGMLQAQARGQGPGQDLVARQAQAQADQSLRNQVAAMQSARPGAGASAAFNAAQAGQQAQGLIGQQRVMGGLQAQLNAIGQLGNVTTAARGQDDESQLRMLGLNDQRQLELLRQRLALQQMQQQGNIQYEANRANRWATAQGTPTSFERSLGAFQGAAQSAGMMMPQKTGGAPPVSDSQFKLLNY